LGQAGDDGEQARVIGRPKSPTPPVNCERASAQSDLAVLEILDHGLKRLAANMNGTGEGMFDRHDHKKTHEHDDDRMPVIMT
jgi:hypothetical protein